MGGRDRERWMVRKRKGKIGREGKKEGVAGRRGRGTKKNNYKCTQAHTITLSLTT